VCAPSVIVLVPLVSTWMLQSHGLRRPMRCSPPCPAVSVIANLFIVDRPPEIKRRIDGFRRRMVP